MFNQSIQIAIGLLIFFVASLMLKAIARAVYKDAGWKWNKPDKVEYKVFHAINFKSLTDSLPKIGEEGWEFVTIGEEMVFGVKHLSVVFKRTIKS